MTSIIQANEQTWTFRDKSQWGEGEWSSEPDKIQYTDPDTGYPCLVVRSPLGALCGYVGVAEGHPFFNYPGSSWDDDGHPENVLKVHGGITFTGFCQEDDKEHGICHIPDPGQPDRVFWYGFDCGHYCDLMPTMRTYPYPYFGDTGATYKNVAYVKEQIKALAAQLYVLR